MQRSTLGSFSAATVALLLASCGGGGSDGNPQPPPLPTNVPPTASAGTNQTVSGGVLVTLNGTGSIDSDGSIASYAWTQTAGTAVTLSNAAASQPTFTAPSVGATATLTFSLVVTDNGGLASAASTVNVTVTPAGSNVPPTANAGPAQTVSAGAVVTLNGTGSTDSDGTIASYAWTQTVGAPVTLSNAAVAQPTFTAPQVALATTISFSLIVTDNLGATSTASTVDITVNPAATGTVTGRIRFTRIPTSANGLSYGSPQLQVARGVQVQAVSPAAPTVPLASTSTDASGNYSLTVAPNTNIQIVVVAQMLRDASQPLPRWDFRAQDNDAANPAPYTYTDGQSFDSSASAAHNVDIPSGFSTTGTVTGTRASAPFAVLDTVYQGMQLVLGAAPTTNFPALILDWASDNPGGDTFFDPNGAQNIVLSADPTEDTDEFDQHVIAHEFGHYIEFNFSRADNIGGSHGLGDKLDIRVAFGEGFGYAFAAMVLNDPLARDTYTSQTNFVGCSAAGGGTFLCTSTFNIETNPSTTPPGSPSGNYGCWCSESSVWSILWDIYDTQADGSDNISLGFQPLWNVLTGSQRTTRAFTSIFSFIDGLKDSQPASAVAIDNLLAAQNISGVQDIFGSGETHFPNNVASNAALPIYTDIVVGGGPVIVRNVDDAGRYNTLGNRRFLKFTLATPRVITISVSSSNIDVNADPDFIVYRNGVQLNLATQDPPPQPETVSFSATNGDYLLDVYDCANGCGAEEGTPGDYNLTVTVN